MEKNPFAPALRHLPQELPIFPLSGVLLLPGGQLPLNIFEPRYLAMVEDALGNSRMIGMVQPTGPETGAETPIFHMGCAGKITEFSETPDGRYLITLTGIARFDIDRELPLRQGYRCVEPRWISYEDDLFQRSCLNLDRGRLKTMLETYFKSEGMDCDWVAIDGAPDGRLITCLAMVCTFDAREKQALLEAPCSKTRADMFMTMLEMAIREDRNCKSRH
jgi:uncharacterized protein